METTLLDIEIPVDQIKQAEREIGKARAQIEALKEANKELDKSSDAYTNNAIKIKQLNGEVRTNERLIIANTKANQANKGSIEQLRSQLSTTTTQWAKLSKEERENTDAGKALTKQKLELTNELKRLEKQTGDTRRNVGNYSEGVKEALQESGLFSKQMQVVNQVTNIYNTTLNSISKTFNKYTQVNVDARQATVATTAATEAQGAATAATTTATGGLTKALRILKVALISTGIGAIVVALGSLVAAFLSTQGGIDKVTAVTRPLVAVFQNLKGLVQDLAGNVFAGLSAILKGDFSEGINLIKNGFKEAIGGTKDAIKEGIEAGKELDRLQKQIEKTEVDLTRRRAELNNEFERNKSLSQDITLSEEERIAAAQKAIAAQSTLQKEEQALLDLRIEKKELENSLNDTSREDEKELQQLLAQRIELEARATQRSTEARNLLNTIRKQAAAEQEKQNAEIEKAPKEEAERQAELIQERLESELEEAERQAQAELNVLREKFLKGEILQEDYNKRVEEMELASLEAQKELLEQFGQDTMDIESRILEFKVASKQTDVDTTKIAETTKLDQAENTINALASTMNKQTAVGKALSSAQTAISTYKAATAALEPPPTGLGPVFGPVLAALTTINGLAQVAKINSTQLPKFATGVIGVDGPGTGTSDSINAKISAGESVMTAKATSKYAPLLASLEKSVGNNPNIGKIGRAKFADGVINAGVNVTRQAAQMDGMRTRDLVSAISSQPIYVSLTELDEEQIKYNRARSVSVVE